MTHRHTDRHTDTLTDTQKDKTDGAGGLRGRQTNRKLQIQKTERQTKIQIGMQIDRY